MLTSNENKLSKLLYLGSSQTTPTMFPIISTLNSYNFKQYLISISGSYFEYSISLIELPLNTGRLLPLNKSVTKYFI